MREVAGKVAAVRSWFLLACLGALLAFGMSVLPCNASATNPQIQSWNPPSTLAADTPYTIRVYFDAPVAQTTWVQINGSGFGNSVTVPSGATYADVDVWTPEFGGSGSLSIGVAVGISVANGSGPQENVTTDSDSAQALWAD